MSGSNRFAFSKLLMLLVTTLVFAVTIYTFFFCWKTNDSAPLLYLIPAVFGLVSICGAFYLNKSKWEHLKGGIDYEMAVKREKDKLEEDHAL